MSDARFTHIHITFRTLIGPFTDFSTLYRFVFTLNEEKKTAKPREIEREMGKRFVPHKSIY